MKVFNIYKVFLALALVFGLGACVNDLDVTPIDPNLATADKILDSEEAFYQVLTKIYAGFAVSGQTGPAGDPDLVGFDEGHSQYWRAYFVCQELPTDEAVNGWNDGDLPDISQLDWGANNGFIRQFYYRAIYQVSLANEFIRQANSLGKEEYTNLPQYMAEARFLRALAYWHALDLFGNGVPFVTEDSPIGSVLPLPAGEARGPELFNYIESELMAIVGDTEDDSQVLLDVGQSMGGQANKAAAWMVLAKLYLNHSVYLGETNSEYYTKARTYLNKITSAGYSLITDSEVTDVYTPYERLFLADNYSADSEIIYSINFDGDVSRSYGGMTYVIAASIGGEMTPNEYGMANGWGGNRTTKALVNKFDAADGRALWFTEGQQLEIDQQDQFTHGYAVVKYKNRTRSGGFGTNEGSSDWVDVNVPVFRLADAYLMAAEVDLRLDGSVSAQSLSYLQEIVDRAGVSLPTNVDLDWILDERARELYWECHRRTDLVRFGKFTSGYNWPLKGNSLSGKDVDAKYNLMPIPFTDITANPNLVQNPNY
ncbi:RagB/SusD family nutrient uptake outer membrane protein [Carboxylicivirga linearis]|uniref:RagB/SusD family nutrient uptake outer membrane protein n=1 Tax=Carboxylicivirga linearis TaxID=1628157 RepID=A0ABS5JVK2_9BACT|nr:RagB/SusD family nutrient uptake outer membrane protein [Carboxylicivirga linearis]MBS2098943.1 RagB/SusD family nutrient uptake outer membrane protein [Carboxylicivirga linearis]